MIRYLALFASISLFGAQSLKLGVGVTGQANMNTAAAPFRRADILDTTQVFQFRLHSLNGGNIPIPGSRQDLFAINGGNTFWIFVNTDGTMSIVDWYDSFAGGDGNNTLNINGRSDIIVQIVRKIVPTGTSQYWVEMWNIDGSGYQIGSTKTIISRGDGPSGGGTLGQINLKGDGLTGAAVAWWRWKAGVSIDPGGPSPKGSDPVSGYMAAYEFESESAGNSPDSSTHNTPMALSGTRQYLTSLVYAPACSAGAEQSFRAGVVGQLDASASGPLDEGSTISYEWQQIGGPKSLNWTSHTVQQPTVSGSVAGTYTFRLRVTDGSGQKSTCTVSHGFVATDSKGVAIISNPDHAILIKNLTRIGVNPWPWFDKKEIEFLDWLVSHMSDYYKGYWDTEDEGTVQINSSQIIGTGTHFQSLFCGGGTTPTIDAASGIGAFQIVVHYPYNAVTGYNGLTGRQELPIWRCTSDTLLEIGRSNGDTAYYWIGNAVIPGPGVSGVKYNAVTDAAERNSWVGSGSRPLNYYDNVLALYTTYYRTGNTKYRDAARTLADRFWRQPWVDRAARFDGAGGGLTIPNRSMSLTGVMLRALDSPPEDMWPSLRRMLNYLIQFSGLNYAADNYDFREGGYGMKWVSEMGILDSASRSAAVTKVLNMLTNKWTPQRQPDGSWNNFTGGWFHTALGGVNGVGTVALTNGSTSVVGSGSNLNSGIGGADACNVVGNYIVFYPTTATSYTTSSGANTGDQTGYLVASVTDNTHMTLTTPYTGTTGSKYWACGYGSVGMGKQPFMLGITAQSFAASADLLAVADSTTYASQIALYRSYAVDIGNWLEANRSPDGGIFYTRSPSCDGVQPAVIKDPSYCDTGRGNIINYAEAAYADAQAYILSPSTGLKNTNDAIWAMMFGKPATGAISEDPRWLWELDNYMATTSNAGVMGKWLGFFFGVGRLVEWPSIRDGGLDAPSTHSINVWLGAPSTVNPACASWRLSTIDATGAAPSPTTCSTASCTVTADARSVTSNVQAECMNSGGTAAIRTLNLPVVLQ